MKKGKSLHKSRARTQVLSVSRKRSSKMTFTTTMAADFPEGHSQFPTLTHLITLPFPSHKAPSHLVAHTTVFAQGKSLFVWCGESNIHRPQQQKGEREKSSLLLEEHHAQSYPLKNPSDHNLTSNAPPTGIIAREWAVAMNNAQRKVSRFYKEILRLILQ